MNQHAFESALYGGSNALKIIFMRPFCHKVIGGETESKLFNVRTVCMTLSGQNNLLFDNCLQDQIIRCHNSNL